MVYSVRRGAGSNGDKLDSPKQGWITRGRGCLDTISRVFPGGFPIGILRVHGVTRREIADVLEMEGEVYVMVPGSDQPYHARKARVSWVTPLDIEILGIESKQQKGCTGLKLGRIKVKEYKPPQVIPITGSDPNIVIYTVEGELRLNQVLGIPQFYVQNCRVTYTGNRSV
ncbi:MAG: hypothetical protein KKC75_08345 [Nanoarchaeota archaeon]|nr:hypothetical protein [Nanoarchaeota archaeon]MBU1004481.1 hypothetical protein [Nanoarchaeota archaeon]MBU1945651.1 hypothetical protein [Nanoarchaeota archaeon]